MDIKPDLAEFNSLIIRSVSSICQNDQKFAAETLGMHHEIVELFALASEQQLKKLEEIPIVTSVQFAKDCSVWEELFSVGRTV